MTIIDYCFICFIGGAGVAFWVLAACLIKDTFFPSKPNSKHNKLND